MSMPIQRRLSFGGGGDGSATAAEGIEDNVAFVRRSADYSFEQGFGLLCGVTDAFGGPGILSALCHPRYSGCERRAFHQEIACSAGCLILYSAVCLRVQTSPYFLWNTPNIGLRRVSRHAIHTPCRHRVWRRSGRSRCNVCPFYLQCTYKTSLHNSCCKA